MQQLPVTVLPSAESGSVSVIPLTLHVYVLPEQVHVPVGVHIGQEACEMPFGKLTTGYVCPVEMTRTVQVPMNLRAQLDGGEAAARPVDVTVNTAASASAYI